MDENLVMCVTAQAPCEGFKEICSERNSNLRKGEQLLMCVRF